MEQNATEHSQSSPDNQKLVELEAQLTEMQRRTKGLEGQISELWICVGGLLALVMLGVRLMHEVTLMGGFYFIINVVLTSLFGMLVGLTAARWQRHKTR